MAKLYNLARMTTATTGTGTITLGSAVSSYLSFAASGVQNGDTVTYAIVDGSNREIGRGVYTASGTTLTRTVLESTNSNTAINLSGNAEVFITAAGEDITSDVQITGGSISGITDLAVADGGTGASSFTAYAVLAGGTTSTGPVQNVSGLGTSGQLLTSNGAGALPTWQSPATASGTLLRAPQILTSGTSYTTPAGCNTIYIELVGGGGGGGGADSSADGRYQASGGGGSGAYAAKYFSVSPSTSYTYAIGAGGNGGANTGATGSTGGSTTFTVGATTVTAAGGTGGQGYQSSGSNSGRPARGGGGGAATNGDLNVNGNSGSMGFVNTDSIQYYATGSGGGSFFGGGAQGLNATGTGTAGTSGGGGSGAASSLATGNTGGAGGAGLIRIWEYA